MDYFFTLSHQTVSKKEWYMEPFNLYDGIGK